MLCCFRAIVLAWYLNLGLSTLSCADDWDCPTRGSNLLQTHGSIIAVDGHGANRLGTLVDCAGAEVVDRQNILPAIQLKKRTRPARLVDTFAYGDPSEYQELLLRLEEMGSAMDEVHIVEGDRNFHGESKAFTFQELKDKHLEISPWLEKIHISLCAYP